MRKILCTLLILSITLGCKKNDTTYTLPQEAEVFYNFYVLNNRGNKMPNGFMLSKLGDGSFYGKYFNTVPKTTILDVNVIRATKDTLEFGVEGREESYFITDLEMLDRKAKLTATDNYSKKYELLMGPQAAQIVIDFDEGLYDRIINDGEPINREEHIDEVLPEFADVRGLLINSKNPNEAEKLLGKPSEEWNKRLITYSLYYFKARHNGKDGHVKVIYDNGEGILGKVEDVSFHIPGEKITVGRYSSVRSPK